MTPVVVEVGPVTVRGPGTAPAEWVEQALACLGDRLTIVGGRLVEVADLWGDVLAAACGEPPQTLALVLPSWWSAAAAAIVAAAAREVTGDVVVFRRALLLATAHDVTVVELADDLVVVQAPDATMRVVEREKRTVTGIVDELGTALLDVPAGVRPAPDRRCDRSGRRHIVSAVAAATAPSPRRWRVGPQRAAALVGCALAAVGVGPWWARDAAPTPWVALTEGRVTIEVPAGWTVQRITAGPGSARVQVSAPGGVPALHLTQSVTSEPASLPDVAESLRPAIDVAPSGVFVDFRADGEVGGRPAVTYRELRAGSRTDWAVLVDGDVRIAVGCQTGRGPAERLGEECLRAVRSARAVP